MLCGTGDGALRATKTLVLVGRDDEAAMLYPANRHIANSGMSLHRYTYSLHERRQYRRRRRERLEDGRDAFLKALDLAENLPYRVEQARMLLAHGEPGERTCALQSLGEASTLSESMGADGLVELIDPLLKEAGSCE